MPAGFDWLAVGHRLELALGRELQKMHMGLTERAIIVGLRGQRVQPAFDVMLLDCLLKPGTNIHPLMGNGVDLVKLGGIGVTIRQRGRIFERRCRQRRALFATVEK